MGRLTAEAVWEGSLLARLVAFAFAAWDDSLTGRALAALGRWFGRTFEDSYPGRVWYSNWPLPAQAADSATGRVLAWLAGLFAALGRAVGPFLARTWESSLIAGLLRWVRRTFGPWAESSVLVQGYSGFARDVVLSPTETGRRATSPVVYLLGIVIGLIPLVPTDFGGLPSPTLLMVAGIWGTALLWFIRKLMMQDFRWRASSGFLPLAVFLVIAAAATWQSAARSSSLLNFVIWVSAALLFWMVVNTVRNSRDAAVLVGAVMAGACVMAVWGVYQYFVPPVITEHWTDPTISGQLTRVFASLGNPNYLAEYMELYLPLVVALFIQTPKRRLELAVPLLLMTLALVLTYSRGGYAALAIALVLIVFMRAPRLTILLFCGAVLIPFVAPASVMTRITSGGADAWRMISALATGQQVVLADSSNAYRVNLWVGIGSMLKHYWFLGTGLGADAFVKVYENYMLSGAIAAHAHNTYIEMVSETGVLGILAILWAMLANIRRTFTVGSNPRNAMLIAAVPAALVALMFHGLVEHIWYNPKLLFAFWAVAGIGMGLALGDREDAAA